MPAYSCPNNLDADTTILSDFGSSRSSSISDWLILRTGAVRPNGVNAGRDGVAGPVPGRGRDGALPAFATGAPTAFAFAAGALAALADGALVVGLTLVCTRAILHGLAGSMSALDPDVKSIASAHIWSNVEDLAQDQQLGLAASRLLWGALSMVVLTLIRHPCRAQCGRSVWWCWGGLCRGGMGAVRGARVGATGPGGAQGFSVRPCPSSPASVRSAGLRTPAGPRSTRWV